MTMQLHCDTAMWTSRTLSDNPSKQSMRTMCNLTTQIIESIYYHRKIAPDNCFASKNVDGVVVKKFKPNINDPAVVSANQWIDGTLDAFRRGYLSKVIMSIYAQNRKDDAIETYKLEFRPLSEPKRIPTAEYTQNIAKFFMDVEYFLTTKLKPLPDDDHIVVDFGIAIRRAPLDYSPLHFNTESTKKSWIVGSEMRQDTIGVANTSHHSLRFKVKGYFEQSINEDDNTIVMDEEPRPDSPVIISDSEEEQNTHPISKRKQKWIPNTSMKRLRRRSNASVICVEDPTNRSDTVSGSLLNCSLDSIYNTDVESDYYSELETSVVSEKFVKSDQLQIAGSQDTSSSIIIKMGNIMVDCICNTAFRNRYVSLVKCGYCSKYEHAECYAIKNVDLMVPKMMHCCVQCALDKSTDTNKIKCTDHRLLNYTKKELLAIGLLRLAVIMKRRGGLDLEDLRDQFDKGELALIFNTFINLRILRKTTANKFDYNVAKLNNFYKLHFKGKHNHQNVDLLSPSQRSANLE